MSHTPGPWNLYPNSASDWVVRKMFTDGQEAHEIARCKSGMDNARLIAAAPEMYSLLAMMAKNGNNAARQLIERIGNEKV